MRAEFLEVTPAERTQEGTDLHAEVFSDTDGTKLATVFRLIGAPPVYVCSCWASPRDRWDCPHILVVKAAVAAAKPEAAA